MKLRSIRVKMIIDTAFASGVCKITTINNSSDQPAEASSPLMCTQLRNTCCVTSLADAEIFAVFHKEDAYNVCYKTLTFSLFIDVRQNFTLLNTDH